MSETTSTNPIKRIAEEPEHVAPAVKAAVAPSWIRRNRARLFQVYVLVAVAIFGTLAFYAHSMNYFPLDLQISLAIQEINNPAFDVIMRFLTTLGFAPQVDLFWSLTALFLYISGLKWESTMSLFGVGGASVLGEGIKFIVARPRPGANLVHVFQTLGEYSFPSGHVLFYVSFVGFLWFLCYTIVKRGWRRTLALWVFGLMVALAGLSRIYLGEHWPSDVFGSYLLGSVWLALTIAVYRWGKPRIFTTQPVAADKPQFTAGPVLKG